VAQGFSCALVESIAESFLDKLTQGCALDRSQCASASRGIGGCIDGGESAGTSHVDGCGYPFGDYVVERTTSATIARTYLNNSPFYINYLGYRNFFTAGAEGFIDYAFEANLATLTPVLADGCTFLFNDNQCSCVQNFCDDSQTTFGFFVDCSVFEGGSVIDGCQPVPQLTENSPLMEILFWLPTALCQAPTGSAPTDGGGDTAPAVAPVEPTATEPDESPAPVVVQETTPSPVPSSEMAIMSPTKAPVDEQGPVVEDPTTSGGSPKMEAGRLCSIIIVVGMTMF